LWGTAGVDHERGGFFEELNLSGRPTAVPFKRTRVLCRQVYVFSHASLLGWEPGADLSAMGYDYLVRNAFLGRDQGWARRLTAHGGVLDGTPDLYDLSFVLFALAWRYKASGDKSALTRAHEALDFIHRRLRHPSGAGFWHEWPPQGPRQQNPHMHLLEACLVAFDASNEGRFMEWATQLVDLFRNRFYDGRTLAEYFTDDWHREPGDGGRIVEPGHMFEWAWILCTYQRLTGRNLSAESTGLVEFSERHGVDLATHLTFNRVRDDGAVLDRGSRTWPNTERIKGHLALMEHGDHDGGEAIAASARVLLDRYFDVSPRGSWMDHFDAGGQPIATVVPASTLYHVFLAFAEILRLEKRLNPSE
jgi:mannose/cellobiose epimerase-like protein (N-acyl-D-glucosamine 2-epimerase family)